MSAWVLSNDDDSTAKAGSLNTVVEKRNAAVVLLTKTVGGGQCLAKFLVARGRRRRMPCRSEEAVI